MTALDLTHTVTSPPKKYLGVLLRSTLSIILVGGLIYRIGSVEVLAQIRSVRWDIFSLAVVLLASQVLFVTPRWAMLLSILGYRIKTLALAGSVLLGFLFNQFLPSSVGGDAIRVWRARQLGVPIEAGIHSVLLDRAFGLLFVLGGTVLLLPFAASDHVRISLMWPIGILAAGGICFCGVLWALITLRPSAISIIARLQRIAAAFTGSILLFARRLPAALSILALSACGQIIVVLAIGLLAAAMGIQLSMIDIAIVSFGAMLAAAVPISFAGWGVREGALVFLFGLYSVPSGTALALSILFGVSLMIAAAPGALVLLAGPRLRDLRPADDRAPTSSHTP